jgi:invasion protein IalB
MLSTEAAFRLAKRCLCISTIAALLAVVSPPDAAHASEPIYSPWEKYHIPGETRIHMIVRLASDCKPLLATVVLIERTGESKKTLRVTFPNNMGLDAISISVDQGRPVWRRVGECHPLGCSADYEVDAKLVDQLKGGTILVIEATSAAEVPMIYRLPLASFGQTYDDPPMKPKEFEPVKPKEFEVKQKALQEELERRARGEPAAKPRAPEQNHMAGCETESR